MYNLCVLRKKLNELTVLSNTMVDVSGFVKPGQTDVEKFRRFPLRRIQPVLKKFFTIFQLNLDRLQQHRQNIEKFSDSSADLSREYIYSLRSVEQLVLTLKQIRQTRNQLVPGDIPEFDVQLTNLLNGAVLMTAQFLVQLSNGCHKEASEKATELDPQTPGVSALNDMVYCSICTDIFVDPRGLPCMHTFCLRCLQNYTKCKIPGRAILCPICRREYLLPAGGAEGIPKNFMMVELLHMKQNTAGNSIKEPVKTHFDACKEDVTPTENENLVALETKLREFNDLVQEIFSLIEVHHGSFQPESETTLSVNESETGSLSNFKLLLLPVAGAVIGGALAGPVGLVAGLKVGKVAAFGGGLLGLTGGTLLKRKQETERSQSFEEATDHPSREIDYIRSTSSPAISMAGRKLSISDNEMK